MHGLFTHIPSGQKMCFHAEPTPKLDQLHTEINLLPAFVLLPTNVGNRKRWKEKQRYINHHVKRKQTNIQQKKWRNRQTVKCRNICRCNMKQRHSSCGEKAEMQFVPCLKRRSMSMMCTCVRWSNTLSRSQSDPFPPKTPLVPSAPPLDSGDPPVLSLQHLHSLRPSTFQLRRSKLNLSLNL